MIIDETEWFNFSSGFRHRVDTLAQALAKGEFNTRSRVLYLTPHLWAKSGDLLDELVQRVGGGLKVVSTLDLILGETQAQLLVVDPSYILTREIVQKLTSWVKAGRVVVLPRSPLYTDAGRVELEQVLVRTKRIEVDLGMTYRLHGLGDGKLVIYDVQDSLSMKGEPASSLQTFLASILSLAEVESYCRLGDSRLTYIPLERKQEGGMAVFVLNSTRRQINADIIFPNEVQISDLGTIFLGGAPDLDQPSEESQSNRFSLDVPPFGILPLNVEGLNLEETRERHAAALLATETRENAMHAAISELPGFDPSESLGEMWS